MAKIKIEDATNAQLDYAAALVQGWILRGYFKNEWHDTKGCQTHNQSFRANKEYHPTTDQAQCGALIDAFEINCMISDSKTWDCWKITHETANDKSRLVAAVKAFLWSKNQDGMIDV
jgi:hypothetical protein